MTDKELHDKLVRAIQLLDEMSIKDIDRTAADAIYLELHQIRRELHKRAP